MVDQQGNFTIDWDSKLAEVQNAATKAFVHAYPTRSTMSAEIPIREGDSHWNKIHDSYSWIPTAFAQLRQIPNPVQSQIMGGYFTDVVGTNGNLKSLEVPAAGTLSGADSNLSDVQTYVSHWSGASADSFRGFFAPMPTIIKNQTSATRVLQRSLELNHDLMMCGRADAEKIPDAAIAALEAIANGSSAEDGAVALAVLAAVATIAAGIATIPIGGSGSAVAAGAYTALAGVASGGSVYLQSQPKSGSGAEVKIQGDTVDQVLSGMSDAIQKVQSAITDGEDTLSTILDSVTKAVNETERTKYIAPRPQTFINDGAAKFRPTG